MIYLARHGQTAFNAEGRMQGRLDSPLTALGQAQARAMGETLAGLIGDPGGWRLIASPLGRTQATARAIGARLGLVPEIEHRLIEVSFGRWDGRLRAELAAENPDAFRQSDWQFSAPDGERFEAVQARVTEWLGELEPEAERRVILVAHGGSSRVLRGAYLGLDPAATWAQDAPQDAIFRLVSGSSERIGCAAATGA